MVLEAALGTRGTFRLIAAEERPWASAMFSGARHRLRLEMPAGEAVRFLDGIENAEFDLEEHLLADLSAARVAANDDLVTLEIEALTIEDGRFVLLDLMQDRPRRMVKAHRIITAANDL